MQNQVVHGKQPNMSQQLVHLSFYRFYQVGNAEAMQKLRTHLKAICIGLQLKGTVLIAPEGVNAMVAGSRESIDAFKEVCRTELGVPDRVFREAPAQEEPFKRMLVKLKKEIITVGDPDLRPDLETAERISPVQLKQWMDEGKPFVLLDTRNDYEVAVGTFKGAEELKIQHSRHFNDRVKARLDEAMDSGEWKDRPIVTFCTGGIRCEKGSAVLLKHGMKNVYQLDGGILGYLQENGPAHFEGQCFVFDWRLAVDGNLRPVERSSDPDAVFGSHKLEVESV